MYLISPKISVEILIFLFDPLAKVFQCLQRGVTDSLVRL